LINATNNKRKKEDIMDKEKKTVSHAIEVVRIDV
jgi:hypothetical protein